MGIDWCREVRRHHARGEAAVREIMPVVHEVVQQLRKQKVFQHDHSTLFQLDFSVPERAGT